MKRHLIIAFVFFMLLGFSRSASAQFPECKEWFVDGYGYSILLRDNQAMLVSGIAGTTFVVYDYSPYYCNNDFDAWVYSELANSSGVLSYGRLQSQSWRIEGRHGTFMAQPRTYCVTSAHGFVNYLWVSIPPYPSYTREYTTAYTQDCYTFTPQPTPTPSPTATPTPSPTPCDPFVEDSCQSSIHLDVVPSFIKPSNLPAGDGGGNTATVRLCTRPARPNENVAFRLVFRPAHANSGGHVDYLHTGQRPLGKLANGTGRTGSNGCFSTTYTASHISGTVGVDGTAVGLSTGTEFGVGVQGLVEIPPGVNYGRIINDTAHPVNLAVTSAALTSLVNIANQYKQEFYGNNPIPDNDKIHYNDASLPFGGKFEMAATWSNTGFHFEHRVGKNVDVRCCRNPGNIPRDRRVRLGRIFFEHGSTETQDKTNTLTPHWHLRFYYGGTHRAAERTPHVFVEDVFDAVLKRESTQDEYEIWLDRITTAKAKGSSELLAAAKTFEKEIFASINYGVMSRSHEQFVTDVFWSHVFRDPTENEVTYWVNFLLTQPPSVPQNRRRERLINQFQLGSEFEEIVLGIIDAEIPPEPPPLP